MSIGYPLMAIFGIAFFFVIRDNMNYASDMNEATAPKTKKNN